MQAIDVGGYDLTTTPLFRHIEHLDVFPFGLAGQSARETATEYLNLPTIQRDLGVPPEMLPPAAETAPGHVQPENWMSAAMAPVASFWLPDQPIMRHDRTESVTVSIQQRVLIGDHGLNLLRCGLSITLHQDEHGAFHVASATSTAIADLVVGARAAESFAVLAREADPRPILHKILARLLGLDPSTMRTRNVMLVLFRESVNDPSLRLGISGLVSISAEGLPPNGHYVLADLSEFPNITLIERSPQGTAAVAAQVFAFDPVTATGDLTLRPHRHADILDPHRSVVELQDLTAAGANWSLSGPRIVIESPNPLVIDPPEAPEPLNFTSRSDEFAAVSAYYHTDAMMRMIEGFGFNLDSYFADVNLPITVVHRAKLPVGPSSRDGRAINAFMVPDIASQGRPWDVRILFGLGDLSDWRAPIGIATDQRWVWHEFCHVLILAATGRSEFHFAHSAGDALAAIMSDPAATPMGQDQQIRGMTFPFVGAPQRRHDRCVTCGWGWRGTLYDRPKPTYSISDPAGYRAEQILSSTLFRLYEAVGGQALTPAGNPDQARRWTAAHYVCYLIVRAIRSLPYASTLPTYDPLLFATALQSADVGTQSFNFTCPEYGGPGHQSRRVGGALRKVVRWAFEKQGLYHPGAPRPRNQAGEPPAVDIYIEDAAGRRGEYGFTDNWHANRHWLWIRHAPDGRPTPQAPLLNQDNYVYVKVGNRGSDTALRPWVTVSICAAEAAAVDTWRSPALAPDWTALAPIAGTVITKRVRRNEIVRFGPFAWRPTQGGPNAVLVRATSPGDGSNADGGLLLACAKGPTPVGDLVPYDNNLAYRSWAL